MKSKAQEFYDEVNGKTPTTPRFWINAGTESARQIAYVQSYTSEPTCYLAGALTLTVKQALELRDWLTDTFDNLGQGR